MIADNFIYCRPDSLTEAAEAYKQAASQNRTAQAYGGGSEIITMSRAGSIHPELLIDIKGIPECNILELTDKELIIGAAVTLHTINDSGLFPLLGHAAGRIADHTNQCRITLGGNLCGTIIYRETVLPLLLADADVLIHSPSGVRCVSIHETFDQHMQLEPDEFIFQIRIARSWLKQPYMHVKKTAGEKIDYPLVTACVLTDSDKLRLAFSGICTYPFRSYTLESIMNDTVLQQEDKIAQALDHLPAPPAGDAEGSGSYRRFVFKTLLKNILERQNDDLVYR